MNFTEAFKLSPGDRVAVVGTGGKTALIDRLAEENAPGGGLFGGVLIAPTTRIGLLQVVERPGVRYLGREEEGKLASAPLEEIHAASREYGLTLMEADGSRGLMLKGWAPHEPVVPDFTSLTIGVIPVRALGLAVSEGTVHRLPLFVAQTGLCAGGIVDAAALKRMILWCMDRHAVGRRAIFISQVEKKQQRDAARQIAQEWKDFDGQVLIGSAREGGIWSAN